MFELTEDTILNGRLKLFQPKVGYRIAIDPFLLSYFAHISDNSRVLDVGSGVGTVSLILKTINPSISISALDVDEYICEICKKNTLLNNLEIDVINDNINSNTLKGMTFNSIVTNPPFFIKELSRVSATKYNANFETITLTEWIFFCMKRLDNSGNFTIIHDASRVDDIICSVSKFAGNIEIIPIYSKNNMPAKRVIVRCKKNSKSSTKILPGIVMHNNDGSYSDEAQKILKFDAII